MSKVVKNIMEYMNSRSKKQFTYFQVQAIRVAIREEYNYRKIHGIEIKTKTDKGKELINRRVAAIANKKLTKNLLTKEDVRLYKKCVADEYSDRTGKCAWGFKEVRKRLGYDPVTGVEIEN
ncbi:hypothetical protein [Fusobacterium varium]